MKEFRWHADILTLNTGEDHQQELEYSHLDIAASVSAAEKIVCASQTLCSAFTHIQSEETGRQSYLD